LLNKKPMASAIAGAFLAVPAVAFAQASNVTISGRAVLGIDQYQATGATLGSANDWKARTRVYDSSSRLIIQGTEDLGGGLTAYFYTESGVNIDSGSQSSQGAGINSTSGFLASRNAWVGLRGGWGAVQFGKPNVWWGNAGVFQNQSASWLTADVPFLTGGLGRGMGVGVSRQSNTVTYITPVLSGITTSIHYSANAQEAAAAGANADGKLWSFTSNGVWGAWEAGVDYVDTRANSPATGPQGKGTAWKTRLGYTYKPGAQVKILWMNSNKKNGGAASSYGGLPDAGTDLKQDGWAIGWDQFFGNVQLLAQYGKTSNISGCLVGANCNDTNGSAYQLGVRYLFSKRTWVSAQYSSTSNAANYNMDYTSGSFSSASSGTTVGLPANSRGADPRIFGIGIAHMF
jgi:predicted porin